MMGKLETYYLFVSVTISIVPSRDPSSRNVEYRFEGVVGNGYTFHVTDDFSYNRGTSVFLLSRNGAIDR